MNDLEMELQTIRQKLQTLKAAPPEPIAAPWGQSRQTAPSPDLVQVTTAIETLRQRSGQPHALGASQPNLKQFDDTLAAVERLAQQQQEALRQLRAVGDDLMQQTQPGVSPDIDEIARFLAECQPIQIPIVRRDGNGYLDLRYRMVDFRRAEHDANSNAEQLRSRSQLFKYAAQPAHNQQRSQFENTHYPERAPQNLLDDLRGLYTVSSQAMAKWLRQSRPSTSRPRSSQFTLVDSAIWCVGAAIARIILNQIFQFYPALWTPVAVILIVGIVISLYSSIFGPRPNPALGYRTLLIIVGLLVGGRFS